MKQPAILIHVQHLLGIGHLHRAHALAQALIARGAAVTLVTGGMPLPEFDLPGGTLVQLEPIKAEDAGFSRLVDQDGHEVTAALETRRRDHLLALYDETTPDVVITETFPLGRRRMRFELMPLLERAKTGDKPPLIVGSVRDILVRPTKDGRAQEWVDLARAHYDHILVHSDETLIPLTASFPETEQIDDLLAYTGFIMRNRIEALPAAEKDRTVLVSAGGGAEGTPVYETVLDVVEKRPDLRERFFWHLLIGWSLPDSQFARFQDKARLLGDRVLVERARTDFPDLLNRASLSLSQAGYNTIMDLLQTGTKAILLPFATNSETEQTVRADVLEKAGRAIALGPDQAGPEGLGAAIDDIMKRPAKLMTVDRNGAKTAATMILGWLEERA